MQSRKTLVVLALLTALTVLPSMAHALAVDLEMVLSVDVSGSISSSEYSLQMDGYAAAFDSAAVQAEIAAGGGVAVCMIQWSDYDQQSKVIDWTLLTDAASCAAFADVLEVTGRAYSNSTAPQGGINAAVAELAADNGYEGTRMVIDLSGDGTQNDPDGDYTRTDNARDAAAAAGITINGLAIGGASIESWYNAHVKTPDGFVVAASDFGDFADAVEDKIITEIVGYIPEPVTMAALCMGIAGLGGYIRKRRMA
jgi:hypothetical protein